MSFKVIKGKTETLEKRRYFRRGLIYNFKLGIYICHIKIENPMGFVKIQRASEVSSGESTKSEKLKRQWAVHPNFVVSSPPKKGPGICSILKMKL